MDARAHGRWSYADLVVAVDHNLINQRCRLLTQCCCLDALICQPAHALCDATWHEVMSTWGHCIVISVYNIVCCWKGPMSGLACISVTRSACLGSAAGHLYSVSCLAVHNWSLVQQMNEYVPAVKYAQCCVCVGLLPRVYTCNLH